MYRRLVLLLFPFLVSTCGGGAIAPTAPLGGQWQGTFQTPDDGPGTFTLQLEHRGLTISGTGTLTQNGIADVPATWTGTLDGPWPPTTMRFTVSYVYGFQCHGSFSGTLNVTARDMDGSFTGQNCVRPFAGTLHGSRSQ
jgi:hypothetical protein